jgi:hypothetical protein
MPFLDRDSFIALLDRLGDADDAKTLAAAREIHQRMTAANLQWKDLLLPPDGVETAGDDTDSGDGGAPLDRPAAPAGEDYALIDRLLARTSLSKDTRDELAGLRADIDSGEFTARDRKYLQSLDARLGR